MDIFQYGLQGVIAYGTVGVISLIADKKAFFIPSEVKFALLVGIAFLVGFIPADLGNMLLNHIKEAVAIGLAVNSFNTFAKKIGGN